MNQEQTQEALTLDKAEQARFQEMAEQQFIKVQQEMLPNEAENNKIINPYPFGGSFTLGGLGYFVLHSVTPLEFTNGVQLHFKGEGGGLVAGGGIYAGAGVFTVDPRTLPQKRVGFQVLAGPGVPAPLLITWYYDGRPIGTFAGGGASAFFGTGGGPGEFKYA